MCVMKEKIVKIIYVVIWTVVMCYASFSVVFTGQFGSVLNSEKSIDLASKYIFPLFIAVALYLIDDIYNALLLSKQDRPFHSVTILFSMLGFLVGFLFSVYSGTLWVQVSMFILAWFSLGFLKFYETPSLCLDHTCRNVGYEVFEC